MVKSTTPKSPESCQIPFLMASPLKNLAPNEMNISIQFVQLDGRY